MKKLFVLNILMLLLKLGVAQNFTYSGYIYSANGSGAQNVPVKVYKRTTPNIVGFTSQTNYNGHSYYRSIGTSTWTQAKVECENMGGHLVTISDAAENNFIFNQWPSGWIGYYQDKSGAFYSEPNAGWRWTENYVTSGQEANYEVSSYSSGSTLADVKSGLNATLYNSPVLTTGGGKYLTFNGVNQYGITGNLTSKFGTSEVISIMMWVYPISNGVILSELGAPSASSGWHESVFEITGGNTLRIGLWNGAGISQVNTPITLNTWNLIGLTYNGTTLTGYKNGSSIGSITFNREAPHNNGGGEYFAFGLSDITNMGSGAYGNFRMGNLQIYSSSLSPDQMNRNYMSSAYRFGVYPFSNWNPGEPNDAGGEDYIQFVGGGKWNDLPNSYSFQYVIEFDYIVTTSPWILDTIVYTNPSGYYSVNRSTNPSIERYIQIDTVTPVNPPMLTDIRNIQNIVVGNTLLKGLHYFLYDLNGDDRVSVSDASLVNSKRTGRITNWPSSFNSRIFTVSEFNSINSSNLDLRLLYPGLTTIQIINPASGGSSSFYLIAPGYGGSVSY
jgi:hypothetical protein